MLRRAVAVLKDVVVLHLEAPRGHGLRVGLEGFLGRPTQVKILAGRAGGRPVGRRLTKRRRYFALCPPAKGLAQPQGEVSDRPLALARVPGNGPRRTERFGWSGQRATGKPSSRVRPNCQNHSAQQQYLARNRIRRSSFLRAKANMGASRWSASRGEKERA
jgi:hypothetical protein